MQDQLQHTTYQLVNNIHYITLKTSSRLAIDEAFLIINHILMQSHENDFVRFFFDMGDLQDLPVMYAMKQAERWEKNHGGLQRSSYTALVISGNALLLNLVNLLASLFGSKDRFIRLFIADQRQEAINWLTGNSSN